MLESLKPKGPNGLRDRYEPLPHVEPIKYYESTSIEKLIQSFYKHNGKIYSYAPLSFKRFPHSPFGNTYYALAYRKGFYITITREQRDLQICKLFYKSSQAKHGYIIATFELILPFYTTKLWLKELARMLKAKEIQSLNTMKHNQIPL